MVVNSKNFVLLCITLYSLLLCIIPYYSVRLRETLWYSVVKLRLHPSLKKIFLFFLFHAVYLYSLHLLIVRTPNQLINNSSKTNPRPYSWLMND